MWVLVCSVPPLTVNFIPCHSCGSENLHRFGAETGIHFLGRENLDKPQVYVNSEIVVCLVCGAAQFAIQETELRLPKKGTVQVQDDSN
jgi:ssDNA-binding Zn-finger/Zn-ribbon topoisomerase 1